jgi:peroxiredoxin
MSEGRERGPLDFDDDAPAEHVPLREPAKPPRPPIMAQSMRYLWVVGAAAVLLVVVLGLATLREGTERGARGVPVGTVMPDFAAPTAQSHLDGAVNLATPGHTGKEVGNVPACTIRSPDVVNICALHAAGPVVLTLFTKSDRCTAQVDAMQQVVEQLPGVRFAAVGIHIDHDDLRKMVARHRWRIPIGWDPDGRLRSAYHAQICPQITFARRGGRVVGTTFGLLTPPELVAKIRALGLS